MIRIICHSFGKSCPTLCNPAACQTSLSFINFQSLFKLMFIESVMPSNHLVLCHPLLLLPSIFPSIRVFSYESALRIRWPKYLSFSFSISPYNEYSGMISFRIGWFQGTSLVTTLQLSSVQFSHSVVSDSLRPRGLQHTRPPCPSPTPGFYSNSCPLSR